MTVPVISNVLDAEVSAVTTAEVVENSRNLDILQTPTYQVKYIKYNFYFDPLKILKFSNSFVTVDQFLLFFLFFSL